MSLNVNALMANKHERRISGIVKKVQMRWILEGGCPVFYFLEKSL